MWAAIERAGETDLFTFDGQTGDFIGLSLVETGGNFIGSLAVPRAQVITPSGNNLGTFDANSQQQFTLPESGTYAARIAADNLVTTGTYNLGLVCP